MKLCECRDVDWRFGLLEYLRQCRPRFRRQERAKWCETIAGRPSIAVAQQDLGDTRHVIVDVERDNVVDSCANEAHYIRSRSVGEIAVRDNV